MAIDPKSSTSKSSVDAAVLRRSVVVGTAGHIDHGKTALIRALTGVDTDRLPEEKRRGITVDLGFAALDTEAPDGSPLRLSFIDVPGHALFVRNMLAGTGGIDAIMLVVSAEEGVKPQTEEHLAICTLLGIERGLTVITKTDAVSAARLEEVCTSVRRFLKHTFLGAGSAPFVTVSAHSGEGLETLRTQLASIAAQMPRRDTHRMTRLPLDRAFAMKGFGTVVTGTLMGGELKAGQALAIEPGNRAVRARGIQVHNHSEGRAEAGSRVAVNLTGVETSALQRGDTLVEASTICAVDTIDAEVTLLPQASELKHRSRVHFHAFTSEAMATVSLYEYQAAAPGSTRLMRLILSKPIVLLPGDRFVIRQSSPAMTIGGGRVLDAHPLEHLRKSRCMAWLVDLKGASVEGQLLLRILRRGMDATSMSQLVSETGIRRERIANLLEPGLREGEVARISDDLFASRIAIEAACAMVMKALEERVRSPGSDRLKRSELRSQCGLSIATCDFIVEKLCREEKLRIDGESVFPFQFDRSLLDSDRQLLISIAASYESGGLTPPTAEETALKLGVDRVEMRRLMTLLLREKTLVKLGSDEIYIHHGALEKLKAQIGAVRGQAIDVARFKQLTGLSRKFAIPLLEYLDRERITRRMGEHRIVL
jgi:selenocysteine-specific elongation factor